MRKFYYYDTGGADTNLQLYSLKQAKEYWTALVEDVKSDPQVPNFHERCVFVITTMGVSVSQLLGQSNPNPGSQVPSPRKLFDSFVDENGLSLDLKKRFSDFIDTYDQCRHFGVTLDGRRHWEVDQVTFSKAKGHYELGLEVWNIVISTYKKRKFNELDDLDINHVENLP